MRWLTTSWRSGVTAICDEDCSARRRGVTASTAQRRRRSQTEIELAHELVVVEFFGRAAFEGDPAVDDDVAAVGDADRLVEVLLGHQHGQAEALLQFLD